MTQADLNECILRLDSYGIEIPRWSSYTFATDFLTPADGFQFSIGDPDIPASFANKIREGLKVGLMVDGRTICTGFIDDVHYEASRDGGTVVTLSGRDVLGDAIDSTIDPTQTFHPTQSLANIIQQVMEPYGFFNEPIVDNEANRDLISGNKYGHKVYQASGTSSRRRRPRRGQSRSKAGQELKSSLEHQSKPYRHEGAYEFCERLAKRQGLHIWATGDGVDLVVGKPEFDQEARYELRRRKGIANGARNNTLSGGVTKSRKNQPSVIVAGGVGGGQDVARATHKVIMVNELIARQADGSLVPQVDQLIKKYPSAYVMGPKDIDGFDPDGVTNVVPPFALNPYPRAKPLYLYDPEARNLEQLKNFVKREMAHRQKQSLACSYEVEGHSQNGVTWAIDTIVHVDDDVADIHEDLYVEGVTFTKSVGQGTRTQLTLIRPYTMVL